MDKNKCPKTKGGIENGLFFEKTSLVTIMLSFSKKEKTVRLHTFFDFLEKRYKNIIFLDIMETTVDTKKENFFCEKCDTTFSNVYNYRRHIATAKHNSLTSVDAKRIKRIKSAPTMYKCICGNTYSSRQGIYKHSKQCIGKQSDNIGLNDIDKSMMVSLLKQNGELQKQIIELSSKTTVIQNNCNNKQFNLNIFLNETCKNAMNLSDFVNSLVIRNEEFENMGKLGYVEGISRILIRGLKELDETKRPMHCTDKKRETIYIKENNVWNKELSQEKMKQLVLDVSFKNVRKIPAWKAENPGCDDTSSNKYMDYVQILNQVMTGIHPDKDSDIEKIIRNVSFAVVLRK